MDFLSLSRGGKFEDARQPKVGWAAYSYTGPSGWECMPTVLGDEMGPFGRNVLAAGRVRRAVRGAGLQTPVIVSGGIHGFDQAEAILAGGHADVIASARQSLADPDWFLKMRLGRGAEVRRCVFTNYCEGLDQMHKQVTCKLWDRLDLDQPGARLASDGRRRLTAPSSAVSGLQPSSVANDVPRWRKAMRIMIVGGGPAGLYFAILMKKHNPRHEIVVFERDGPDDTFGWGIVFSDRTFSYLRDSDEPSYRAIVDSCETWDNVEVVHRGQTVTIRGNKFAGVGRLRFLKALHQRSASLGVDLRFHTNVEDLGQASSYDLVVGADGARSLVRQTFEANFEPTIDWRRNRYIWLGTPRRFEALTLTFREDDAGLFAAHSYRFSPSSSTFIVECGEETWNRAGFDSRSEEETCSYLERVFREDLRGQPLLTNNFVRWLRFALVTNRRWSHGNVILLGDALRTAHFSIGSGTKLALEDAIALAGSFKRHEEVDAALRDFEATRRPQVEKVQAAAHQSLVWFEQMKKYSFLDPLPFAFALMTRSGRIDLEKLRRRDPEFVAACERAAR